MIMQLFAKNQAILSNIEINISNIKKLPEFIVFEFYSSYAGWASKWSLGSESQSNIPWKGILNIEIGSIKSQKEINYSDISVGDYYNSDEDQLTYIISPLKEHYLGCDYTKEPPAPTVVTRSADNFEQFYILCQLTRQGFISEETNQEFQEEVFFQEEYGGHFTPMDEIGNNFTGPKLKFLDAIQKGYSDLNLIKKYSITIDENNIHIVGLTNKEDISKIKQHFEKLIKNSFEIIVMKNIEKDDWMKIKESLSAEMKKFTVRD